jgi:DNA-binding MarR family transcriptional regulator
METIGDVVAKTGKISGLEAHLGYWLRFVSNSVSLSFAQRVARHDVSVAEWVALRELYDRDALAPSELAEKLGMTRGAITKVVDRLIGKSLLVRRAGKGDRRYQELALTAEGRALVPKLAALADENDEIFFGHLKAADRKTIERFMQDIVRRNQLRAMPID